MTETTLRILKFFADGKVHDSREVFTALYSNDNSQTRDQCFNAMTRLATRYGYLDRRGSVKSAIDNRPTQTYSITELGLHMLSQPHVPFVGRGLAAKPAPRTGRMITFDPYERTGEYFAYKPAPAIRVNNYRAGSASSERI